MTRVELTFPSHVNVASDWLLSDSTGFPLVSVELSDRSQRLSIALSSEAAHSLADHLRLMAEVCEEQRRRKFTEVQAAIYGDASQPCTHRGG